ncbi:helicase mov-10-B.1-like [Thraustotheca clavata]|uniref:Helicase mov-10-B.1-like n=1 Tax=Thraustotheca clavata TaxID=74557 RepID=A0A1V9ZQM1_9STRA|nr:helicase mov-10-B.1-like [Thraustotheca clavata]
MFKISLQPSSEWFEQVNKTLCNAQAKTSKQKLCQNKFGVEIDTPQVNFGFVDLTISNTPANSEVRGCDQTLPIVITNIGDKLVTLSFAKFLQHSNVFSIILDAPVDILPGSSIALKVSLLQCNDRVSLLQCNDRVSLEGWINAYVLLLFQLPSSGNLDSFTTQSFCITRHFSLFHAKMGDFQSTNLDAEAMTFVPQRWKEAFNQPVRSIASLLTSPLKSPLSNLMDYVLSPYIPVLPASQTAIEMMEALSNDALRLYVYKQMNSLRHEEQQMIQDMNGYDCYNTKLKVMRSRVDGDTIAVQLEVPGLRDGRPNLNLRNHVILRVNHPEWSHAEIHGAIVNIVKTTVTIVLPNTLAHASSLGSYNYSPEEVQELYSTQKFHVRFTYQRTPYQMVLHALSHMTPSTHKLLHPHYVPFHEIEPPMPKQLKLFNKALNKDQFTAVGNILLQSSGDAPFIVFGPPGTGKTVTVIEAILQLLKENPTAKILAVTPSDASADVLANRLRHYLDPSSLFRLNWHFRSTTSLPSALLRFSYIDPGQDIFSLPELDVLEEYRVIVSTACASGILSFAGLPRGHFSNIIVDEACQATEPEVIVPLLFYEEGVHVTLVGDPKQLGPQARSPVAQSFGLAISLLERLMEKAKGVYDWNIKRNGIITMLRCNYRSHPKLLRLPSSLFYENSLVAAGNITKTQSLSTYTSLSFSCDTYPASIRWEGLNNPEFPLVWYGVLGKQHKDLNVSSYTNIAEAFKVLELVEKLLSSKTVTVSTADIAVITPYRLQVIKLRQLLRNRGLNGINIGTVYNFQGQESRIVILSLVRTPTARCPSTTVVPVLNDPKIFNVGITRSTALLLVVGHPYLNASQPNWKKLLHYCRENEALLLPGDHEKRNEAFWLEDETGDPTEEIVLEGQVNTTARYRNAVEDLDWRLFV